MAKRVAPYGTWSSPISADQIARGALVLAEPTLADGSVWWIEGRPAEGGRQVVVRDGADAIPEGFDARTRVHEYGGGAYAVRGHRLVFSNDEDGRVYSLYGDEAPEPTSPEAARPRSLRYADFHLAADGGVWCVRESHEATGEPANELVRIEAGAVEVVASGHDFYAAPKLSPDGTSLSFLAWDHPRMPWDGSELWLAGADGGGAQLVAGGPEEAIVAPDWSRTGVLHWISDRTGWWNLYADGDRLYAAEAEFAVPAWGLGQAPYAFLDDGRIACAWFTGGLAHLGLLDPDSGVMEELNLPLLPVVLDFALRSDGRRVVYVGASPTRPAAVAMLDAATGEVEILKSSHSEPPECASISVPRAIQFDSHGRTAHAFFYPPCNGEFEAPQDERPPLVVIAHGGPTLQAEPVFNPRIQYWSSRGVAVVDVNYGGSTGYGRAYRELLRGEWGVVDLEDCVAAVRYLVGCGEVDCRRIGIRGGSAGGYTTLCALVFADCFQVGISSCGVADVDSFARDTHKFESRYDLMLVAPGTRAERAPIAFIERISAPMVLLQGLEDKIVPPSQSELIVAALAERGIEHEYHAYGGEGHGFRKAENIRDSVEREFAFYARVLGFMRDSAVSR